MTRRAGSRRRSRIPERPGRAAGRAARACTASSAMTGSARPAGYGSCCALRAPAPGWSAACRRVGWRPRSAMHPRSRRSPRQLPPPTRAPFASPCAPAEILSDDALARLDARAEQIGEPLPVKGGVPEADLVQLGALEEEVQVVLPREADPAVHPQGGRHDALG